MSGTGTSSISNSSSDGSSSLLKRSDRHFIETVGESNQKEIALAELAVQKASSPEVRSYAQQIVNDHQQMASELSQVAQRKGLSLGMSHGNHSNSNALSIGS